jgi:hypothetical protein
MKNFEKFVNHIASEWRKKQKTILESGGLTGISNKEAGLKTELFLLKRMNQILPTYKTVKSKGSFTPADIYAVGYRKNYWHIMLIQVKSAEKGYAIHKLNQSEVSELKELAKLINKEIKTSELTKDYQEKAIVITIGYAGIQDDKNDYIVKDCYPFTLYKHKTAKIYNESIKIKIIEIHSKLKT